MNVSRIPSDEMMDYAPEECLGTGYDLTWHMTRQERFSLMQLLQQLAPDVSIEVGTYKGGSLQVLSRHSKHVISLDINQDVPTELQGRFRNVEFRTGDSAQLLPAMMDELHVSGREVGFILIDADHAEEAVLRDVNAALRLQPRRPACIVMHDSFHPPCRRALRRADWQGNPHVHYVELDFVTGILVPGRTTAERAMFGGLALALLRPEPRATPLAVFESQSTLFEVLTRCADGLLEGLAR